MDLYDTMTTAGTTRHYLPDPVDDDVVARVLDTARFAPSGGNRQGWHVIVVRDHSVRRRLRDLYLGAWQQYLDTASQGRVPFRARGLAPSTPPPPPAGDARQRELLLRRASEFAEHLDEIPVHLLVCLDLRALSVLDGELDRQSIAGGASIYPFVQNVLLGLRHEGLGAAFTTMLLPVEDELRQLFGIPPDFAVAGLISLGYPARPGAPTLSRRPVHEFTTLERFDGKPLRVDR